MNIDLDIPLSAEDIASLRLWDHICLTGYMFTGRDIVLPKIVEAAEQGLLESWGVELAGGVVFHTAVSMAGVGPTSSNKLEIENSIVPLSRHGVRLHIGKGAIGEDTIREMGIYGAAYAVVPPVSALLASKIRTQKILLFPEEGIEAFHLLEVFQFPAIIAGIHGQSVFG